MATRIPMNTRVGVKDTTTTSAPAWCPPPCPACGGLQCLCRPRFFAGQLLTEQDLNRLDAYVRAKNRLHNRYVHGWGVVCGLEVTCHDCENLVRVSAGYGLSPCGDGGGARRPPPGAGQAPASRIRGLSLSGFGAGQPDRGGDSTRAGDWRAPSPRGTSLSRC